MIHALKQIGDYAKKNSNKNMLTQVIENPNSSGKYNHVIIISFIKQKGNIEFDDIIIEEFSKAKLSKYAYKYGNPRGGDLTPTSKITNLEKTFHRIQRPLKKVYNKLSENDKNKEEIIQIYDILQDEEEKEKIISQLKEKVKNVDDEAVLTIGLKSRGGKLNYVGDIDEFTKSLMERYEKKFYYKSSYRKAEKESIGNDNVCYICSKESDETYGYVGTYSFYTLDKPGFTAGGFNRGKAWKNYPVCSDCAKILDFGKDYLEDNLTARFCGLNYIIIPKTVFSEEGEGRKELFAILEELEKHKKMSLKEATRSKLTNAQNDIFAIMSEFDNFTNFNLMFYEEQNSAFRILLYIEDVLPSYIQRIFSVKDVVDREEIFRELTGYDGDIFNLDFKFNLISDFFYVDERNKPDFTEEFLKITNNIFTQTKVSYSMLIQRFIKHIRKKFRNDNPFWFDTLKAIMILKFLKKLNLLTEEEKEVRGLTEIISEYKRQIEAFFNKHQDILNSNEKRMVFLEGVLAQKLLNIQKQQTNGSTPFRARLKGLKINERVARSLYPEMVNKLEEYDKNYYKQLEELIADYALDSDFNKISNTELSFYFVTGMNQAHKFQFTNENEEE